MNISKSCRGTATKKCWVFVKIIRFSIQESLNILNWRLNILIVLESFWPLYSFSFFRCMNKTLYNASKFNLFTCFNLTRGAIQIKSYLTIQSNSFGLTLGTDTSGPRRMSSASRLDTTAYIFQISKLALIKPTAEFPHVGMKGHMFYVVFFQVCWIIRFNWKAMNAWGVITMKTPGTVHTIS